MARQFCEAGFPVRQGSYVKDSKSEVLREVDVLAFLDAPRQDFLLRVYHVVECKWSKDKPWVVFTTDRGMAPAACITQTIASDLASAILWKDAGMKILQSLALFLTPPRSGFNGRQALAKEGNDRFYSAMASIVSSARNVASKYDEPMRKNGQIPKSAVVAFPLIVIQGDLYEAFVESETGELKLNRTPHVRCHWRGSKDWPLHASIDIVTSDHLEQFLRTRKSQVNTLLEVMQASLKEIILCMEARSLESLQVSSGSRGIVGTPPLLMELIGKSPRGKRLIEKPKE